MQVCCLVSYNYSMMSLFNFYPLYPLLLSSLCPECSLNSFLISFHACNAIYIWAYRQLTTFFAVRLYFVVLNPSMCILCIIYTVISDICWSFPGYCSCHALNPVHSSCIIFLCQHYNASLYILMLV